MNVKDIGLNLIKTEMSSVEDFKSAIVRIRDILRKEGITGMDSMRTICIYVLARLLSNKKCIELEIPEEFSWDNIIGLYKKEGGQQLALDYFYNPGNPDRDCLLSFFDTKFKTQKFAFDVKKLVNHKEIIDILNRINLEHVDYHMDIIGYIYEQHLKTGSSSASRDLGQFFTDRCICKYMVELCNPKVLSSGLIETICDPTMGTGGFLSASIKYLNKKYKFDWNIQQNQIYGFDIDPKVTGLANLNVFAESNVAFKNLENDDTLHNGLSLMGYDVILANMPFGIKGLKHADVCKRVNELGIRGTKSEPLFLQLMMVNLNKGGRCAVVVPDGVLINSSNLHNGTRKYLLDNFELHRVIKMDGTFFMNTGIKPSILFFENTGKPTKNIEFWEVSKNDKNEVIEKMIIEINIDQLDKSYSLDVRKFIKKEETVNNTEYEMIKLGVLGFYSKYPSHDTSFGKKSGKYNFITGGESTDLYVDKYDIEGPIVVINRTNGHGKCNVFLGEKCAVAKQTIVLSCENDITTKYLYYWILLNKTKVEEGYVGSNHKNISLEFVKNLEIPLPTLEIQQKIVEMLDRIYESNKIAEGLISNIRERMTDIIRVNDARGFEKVKLRDIIKLETGDYITKKDETFGEYPVYGGGSISFYINKYNRENKCVINKDGMSLECVHLVKSKFFLNHHGWTFNVIDENKNSELFISWCLYLNSKYIYDLAKGSCQKGLNQDDFYNFEITLPPLEVQKDIVRRLENYENQIKSLEDLQKDADDNAKFILDSYFKKSAEDEPIIEPQPPKRKLIRKKVVENSSEKDI